LAVLFIVSVEGGAGKTALCAGLAVNFINEGRKVAYVKSATRADGDASFMKQVPGVEIVEGNSIKGFDIVLMEGRLAKGATTETSQAAYGLAEKTKAKVIAVESYSGESKHYNNVYKGFGGSFLGVVINKVPAGQVKRVQQEVGAGLEAAGTRLLGVIPENRVLMAVTIGELAESLGARMLNNGEKSDDLVENYMLGALVVDSGLDYFGRKSRKAAVLREDRPDMQLAALETSTTCLVLSGEKPPMPAVVFKAESRGIPIITTGSSVNDVIAIIENTLLKTRLKQTKKLARLAETVRNNLNIKSLA
jgi:BioD-like phosphotransacetylase family protein